MPIAMFLRSVREYVVFVLVVITINFVSNAHLVTIILAIKHSSCISACSFVADTSNTAYLFV